MPLLIWILFALDLCCLGISGVLCWKGKEGWGWFLFIAVLLALIIGSQ